MLKSPIFTFFTLRYANLTFGKLEDQHSVKMKNVKLAYISVKKVELADFSMKKSRNLQIYII